MDITLNLKNVFDITSQVGGESLLAQFVCLGTNYFVLGPGVAPLRQVPTGHVLRYAFYPTVARPLITYFGDSVEGLRSPEHGHECLTQQHSTLFKALLLLNQS